MKLALFCLFAAITAFSYRMRYINLRHLKDHGDKVPPGFEGAIDEEKLRTSSAYTFESSRLGLWDSLFDNAVLVIFLFGGLITAYDRYISSFGASPVFSAIIFFLFLTWISTLLGIPFDLYGTFRIEARYGFNTTTARIWITDFIKSLAIGALLLAFLITVVFCLIQWSPLHWWLWVWGFMAVFSLFMMFISPYVIEPLFNKYEPVTEEGLEDDIRVMMEKAGLKVGKVQQMDASRRSRHSNAYFTGIGRVKRIVLYDTLIKQMSHARDRGRAGARDRALEAGAYLEAFIVGGDNGVGRFLGQLQTAELARPAGLLELPTDISLPAKMVLLGFVASLVLFPLGPFSAWRSRCHEREADRFAADLTGRPQDLASAMVKLSVENLSNLFPHPFYAAFYYSHPPAVERVRTLLDWSAETKKHPGN